MYNTKNRYEQGQALRKEIYMYIVSYIKLVGYAPSITEISERVDAGSKLLKPFYELEIKVLSAVNTDVFRVDLDFDEKG